MLPLPAFRGGGGGGVGVLLPLDPLRALGGGGGGVGGLGGPATSPSGVCLADFGLGGGGGGLGGVALSAGVLAPTALPAGSHILKAVNS